jgi:hypothetical protein
VGPRWTSTCNSTTDTCLPRLCKALQHIAEHYKALDILQSTARRYNILQSIARHYNILQSTTRHYNILQSITRHYNTLQSIARHARLSPFKPLHSAIAAIAAPGRSAAGCRAVQGTIMHHKALQSCSTTRHYKLHNSSPHCGIAAGCSQLQDLGTPHSTYKAVQSSTKQYKAL